MRPVVCMITGRSRLPAASGRDASTAIDELVRRVALVAEAGVHLVQIRERDLDGGPLLRLVLACLDAVRVTRTRVIVNERFDVALAAGAHGVHLRGASMPAARVRVQAPAGFLIGRSVHSLDEALGADSAGGLDYLQFGPVFPTRSKVGAAGAGEEALAAVVRAVRVPVLAVGGVTPAFAPIVARAGACGFAAIDLFSSGSDPRAAYEAACAVFDTARRRSLT